MPGRRSDTLSSSTALTRKESMRAITLILVGVDRWPSRVHPCWQRQERHHMTTWTSTRRIPASTCPSRNGAATGSNAEGADDSSGGHLSPRAGEHRVHGPRNLTLPGLQHLPYVFEVSEESRTGRSGRRGPGPDRAPDAAMPSCEAPPAGTIGLHDGHTEGGAGHEVIEVPGWWSRARRAERADDARPVKRSRPASRRPGSPR